MNPTVKYTVARFGLFAVVAAVFALIPVPVNIFLKLMAAVLVSMGLAYFLLRGLRDQMAMQVAGAMKRRAEQRERLRAALSGEDDDGSSDS